MLLAPCHIQLLALSLYHSDWQKKRRAHELFMPMQTIENLSTGAFE
jgi:hypothetical protein